MSDSVSNEQMKFIIRKLLENAADAKRFKEKNGQSDFTDGLLSAYHSMLDTIKNQMIVDDRDLKEYGLDIELEKDLS